MAHASSLSLPRVSDDGEEASPRLLRLRADQRCLEMLRCDPDGRGAYIDVPSREPVVLGEPVRVEISFGAMSDEVELQGRVMAVEPAAEQRPPRVVIRLGDEHVGRARYVRAVLSGDRPASARSHRRVPTDLACRWSQGALEHTSRVRDLSRGGAFIVSTFFPEIGSRVRVGLELAAPEAERHGLDPLRLEGVVTWIRAEGRNSGFGVSFKARDRRVAEQLFRVVRSQERAPAPR
jgi:Tfp pilus assembly protein PilZ